MLKIVRDALILSEAGAVVDSYRRPARRCCCSLFVPAYGAFASRVNRVWLICGVTLFFASNLVIFYCARRAGRSDRDPLLPLDRRVQHGRRSRSSGRSPTICTRTERGKRLFPLVGVGASLGAVVGAGTTRSCSAARSLSLMLIAAAGLLVPVGLTIWVHRRERERRGRDAAARRGRRSRSAGRRLPAGVRRTVSLLIALLVLS